MSQARSGRPTLRKNVAEFPAATFRKFPGNFPIFWPLLGLSKRVRP
jgi:hypothetical protein